jgi:hypothetical protein
MIFSSLDVARTSRNGAACFSQRPKVYQLQHPRSSSLQSIVSRARRGLLFILLLALAGCATTGSRTALAPLPDGDRALVTEILAGLAAQSEAIQSFQAGGTFTLKSPLLEEVQLLRQSSIRFRRPADLHVVGRKYSKAVFRLTCVDSGFLIELPTERQYFASNSGARFDSVSRQVTPAEIAYEMFFPEAWADIAPDQLRVMERGDDGGVRLALFSDDGALKRELAVTGPPWRLVEHSLHGDDGALIARTTQQDYTDASPSFARHIRSEFPGESAYMEFQARALTLNEPPSPVDFDLERQLGEMQALGYTRIEQEQPLGDH